MALVVTAQADSRGSRRHSSAKPTFSYGYSDARLSRLPDVQGTSLTILLHIIRTGDQSRAWRDQGTNAQKGLQMAAFQFCPNHEKNLWEILARGPPDIQATMCSERLPRIPFFFLG